MDEAAVGMYVGGTQNNLCRCSNKCRIGHLRSIKLIKQVPGLSVELHFAHLLERLVIS